MQTSSLNPKHFIIAVKKKNINLSVDRFVVFSCVFGTPNVRTSVLLLIILKKGNSNVVK